MSECIELVSATFISGYKINLKFSDGKEHIVDFEQFLTASKNEHIKKYLDPILFKSFSVVEGDLDWNDYDLCFPIDDLYSNSISAVNSKSTAS